MEYRAGSRVVPAAANSTGSTPLPLRLLCLCCAASLLAPAIAQRKVLRHDATAYAPAEEGRRWVYRRATTLADRPGDQGLAMVSRSVFGTYRQKDGSRWHLLAIDEGGKQVRYEHWNTEGPGLLVERSGIAGGNRTAPACWLAAPVGAVTQWQWNEETPKVSLEVRATIVGFDELVTVPAGTFRCVQVHFGELGGPEVAVERMWFARQVGLVRSVRQVGDETVTTELKEVIPGRDQSADRLATLQVLAPPDWLWSARGASRIQWLDQDVGSVLFGGRFAIVDDGQQRRAAFVGSGTFVAIPDDHVDWRTIQPIAARRSDDLMLATTARLVQRRLGLWDAAIDIDRDARTGELRGTDAAGQRRFEFSLAGSPHRVGIRETTRGAQEPAATEPPAK